MKVFYLNRVLYAEMTFVKCIGLSVPFRACMEIISASCVYTVLLIICNDIRMGLLFYSYLYYPGKLYLCSFWRTLHNEKLLASRRSGNEPTNDLYINFSKMFPNRLADYIYPLRRGFIITKFYISMNLDLS